MGFEWLEPSKSPFVRAYAPSLASWGIDQTSFLNFIDGLNEAFVASPIFQATELAGMFLQFGEPALAACGAVLERTSSMSTLATSYLRAKSYLKKANAEVFYKYGLQVQVMTTKRMLAKIGHREQRLRLIRDRRGSASSESSFTPTEAVARSNESLAGLTEPLEYVVPPQVRPLAGLKRLGSWQAKRVALKQQEEAQKKATQTMKEYQKHVDRAGIEEAKAWEEHSELQRKVGKARAAGRPVDKLERELEKAAEYYRKEQERHMQKGERELDRAVQKNENLVNKIMWVVVTAKGLEETIDVLQWA